MKFDLEKLAQIAKPRSEEAIEKAQKRKENRDWFRISQAIALNLHYYMKKMNLLQKTMAEKMGVSPAYMGRLLKGQENMTIETICKIQRVIEQDVISVNKIYENRVAVNKVHIKSFKTGIYSEIFSNKQDSKIYHTTTTDAA